MRGWTGLAAAMLALGCAPVALASSSDDFSIQGDAASDLPYLQCVPYARQVSGIRIFGDAHTWWDQAAGKYARGSRPKVGAVMSFRPYGAMRLGHVAAVSRVIDSRTVLLRHANWSLIGGRRGQIEDDVRAVDVSDANDWSEVRVWFAPIQALGTTHWPLNGFIYPDKPQDLMEVPRMVLASADARPARKSRIGSDFLRGIALDDKPRKAAATSRPGKRSADPIGEIIARVS
ncbi:CHAP domain-containing protein [Novosphingobium sp. Gsoil 351]|uniref:CHAP domain-containing protein n=1 Tax=Novosphingobium sp. Gsoil 351 TaxID=2675225 RepID=UPI001E45470C|nr:CHAP domain-containing protein [Novosphingobium sp. Gsoil 351]